ncbi:MAG: hypothetical protein AB1716_25165, partial [Planctomycetota bacterium]
GMAIAVVNAAVTLTLGSDGRIGTARVALGAVAPTPVRSPHAEAVLRGQPLDEGVFAAAARAVLYDIAPISDVRGSAEYRRAAAVRLTARALRLAAAQIAEEVRA